jgi:putative tryptophan/tyrosine transport system substrate-binding protein
MRRREFIAMVAGAVGLPGPWSSAAMAQQRPLPLIGFIASDTMNASSFVVQAFREGLEQNGYVEGKNVRIEYRFSGAGTDQLAAMIGGLARDRVALIFAGSTTAALAAKSANITVPVVFATSTNPVEAGLVASLNRPGGNFTGTTTTNLELMPKRLELLRDCVPTATVVAALINDANPALAKPQLNDLGEAARILGVELRVLHAGTEHDLDAAFSSFSQLGAAGLTIAVDTFFNNRLRQLGSLARTHAVPAIYQNREFAAAGGLMSYGGNLANQFHLCGTYAARILKGETPADLPVQQMTKVDLIVNLNTAMALGIAIPEKLLARADEVIE